MSGSTAKLIRKVFKDRQEYRLFKEQYTRSSTQQKEEVLRKIKDIIKSGKKINTGVL